MAKLYENKAWMHKRYVLQKKTAEQIAKECGTTVMTITRWLTKHQLIRNPRSWDVKR